MVVSNALEKGSMGGIECSEEVISEEDLANLIRASELHIFMQVSAPC